MEVEDFEHDEIVEETPEYSAKSDFNKPKLIEEGFRKCFELRSKEMHSGYINTKTSTDGTILKERVEDSRQAFCNSVGALKCLLSPEINRSLKAKKRIKILNRKEKNLWKTYAYKEPINPQNSSDLKITFSEREFLPEMDESLKSLTYSREKKSLVMIKGCWNSYVNAYWNLKVEIRDRMLSYLSRLVDELNYFRQETAY